MHILLLNDRTFRSAQGICICNFRLNISDCILVYMCLLFRFTECFSLYDLVHDVPKRTCVKLSVQYYPCWR